MTKFFHVAPILLNEGSVILPGNFGRIIKLYDPSSVNFEILTRETIFEEIRQKEFPEKPSRLNCLFLLDTLNNAIQYKNQYARWSLIYEIVINKEHYLTHIGSYSFNLPQLHHNSNASTFRPNILQTDGYYYGLAELAKTYWSTTPDYDKEILINSSATIIKQH